MQSTAIIYVFMGLLGLAIGSFLNVLIYRLPREKKTVFERSVCPNCGTRIPFYLNIPLISYIILGGKCRECKSTISIRYPLVEVLNTALFLFFLYLDGLSLHLPVHLFLGSALITIFFIDLEFQIIPDKITLPGILIGLASSFFIDPPGLINALLGFAVGGGSLLGIAYLGEWMFKKEAMGGGDIKMAAMMGAFVGWQKILLIFLGGAVLGLIISILWMGISKQIRNQRIIPFGPFLAVAALVVIVYGDRILHFYISTFLTV